MIVISLKSLVLNQVRKLFIAMQKLLWGKNSNHSSLFLVWKVFIPSGYKKLLRSFVCILITYSFSYYTFSADNSRTVIFHIPKQQADLSLINFAEQADITLLFPVEKVKEKITNSVIGQYSVIDALHKLLDNTGLKPIVSDNGQLSILIDPSFERSKEMVHYKKNTTLTALLTALTTVAIFPQAAAETQEKQEDNIEKISVIGSRSMKQRSIADSPVPVDLISADDLNAVGGSADLTDNLKALIPSYTATPATGDGSAFVRPTSLRGTSPDQTLILVDGKRRHRSALVQFFAPAAGNGAQSADISMIPAIALKRVEVLRDGAASQYGSDAIAGVINFVTKDESDGGTVELQYGQFYEGETSTKFALNKGLELGKDGFANFSMEYVNNDALSRGIQRPDAQAIIDSGVQGVGEDSPFGDAPLVQSWGRPETSALRFFLNSGIQFGDNLLYARANYADTTGRYRFFYRNPNDDDDGRALLDVIALGYDGPLKDTGYTPFLDGDQTDISLTTGYKGEFSNGTYFDFSLGYGKNKLKYFLNNEINSGLGLTADLQIPQMNFDNGGYAQEELNINADLSYPLSDDINLAYGAEWRQEEYTVVAGEFNSYTDSEGNIGTGVDGSISPDDAGVFTRDNYAAYVDVEHDVTDDLLLQYALRYENFSDFGGTTNWKIATNYRITDEVSLRGAISTGFHAPTPGQANVSATISTVDGATGKLVLEGLIPATDPRAVAAGGKKLTEEKSFNMSFGVTSSFGDNSNVTLDFYKIAVDDRIYRTGDIQIEDGSTISFYTNAIDVEHTGLDLVISSSLDWSSAISTDISFAYSYNKIDVVNQRMVSGIQPVSDATVEDIENNFPNSRFVLTTNTPLGEVWNLMLRANYYGSYYDERGTIGGWDGKAPTAQMDPLVYIDAELNYQLNKDLQLKLGFSNLFNVFPNTISAPYANRQSVGLQYPRRAAANYEGGSWYIGLSYNL